VGTCTANGGVVCTSSSSTFQISNSTSGTGISDWYSCGNAAFGPEYVLSVQSQLGDDISLTLTHPSGVDMEVMVLPGGQNPGTCAPNFCNGLGYGSTSPDTLYFEANAGETYFVVVDGVTASDFGAFTLDIECGTPPTVEQCTNGVDDDGDGDADCADPDCTNTFSCIPAENCFDNIDNDQDGLYDCTDLDCAAALNCQDEVCNDGTDNDGDGDTDCVDSDCVGDSSCP
jgi:hypothetical protein